MIARKRTKHHNIRVRWLSDRIAPHLQLGWSARTVADGPSPALCEIIARHYAEAVGHVNHAPEDHGHLQTVQNVGAG